MAKFTPASGTQHPPKPMRGGGGTQAGACGPMTNHGGGYGAGTQPAGSVIRNQGGKNAPPKK
jgi:hypothetical protein